MKQEKMFGEIKWYKKNKGYGYIIGADEETYFFELINCINPNEIFNTGDIVKFIPNMGSIDFATRVEKVKVGSL